LINIIHIVVSLLDLSSSNPDIKTYWICENFKIRRISTYS